MLLIGCRWWDLSLSDGSFYALIITTNLKCNFIPWLRTELTFSWCKYTFVPRLSFRKKPFTMAQTLHKVRCCPCWSCEPFLHPLDLVSGIWSKNTNTRDTLFEANCAFKDTKPQCQMFSRHKLTLLCNFCTTQDYFTCLKTIHLDSGNIRLRGYFQDSVIIMLNCPLRNKCAALRCLFFPTQNGNVLPPHIIFAETRSTKSVSWTATALPNYITPNYTSHQWAELRLSLSGKKKKKTLSLCCVLAVQDESQPFPLSSIWIQLCEYQTLHYTAEIGVENKATPPSVSQDNKHSSTTSFPLQNMATGSTKELFENWSTDAQPGVNRWSDM